MRQARATPQRLDALDGLRGLAAAGVVALHVWMFKWGGAGRPPKQALDVFLGELRLGVPLFFVLSGFLLYRPWLAGALGAPRPSLGGYALRRAARILPAYWAVLAGALALIWATGRPIADDVARLPAFLAFAHNQVPDTRHFNPPLWTIAIEVSFYVALPLLGLLALRIGARPRAQAALVAGLIAAGLAFGLAAKLGDWPLTATLTLPKHLTEFGAGMLAAVAASSVALPRWSGPPVALAGAALVVGDGLWHALGVGALLPRAAVGDFPAAAGFALIVLALVAAPRRRRAWLARPPLRLLGTLSFGIYLWHFPTIRLLRAEELWPQSLGAALALTFAVTSAFAALSWLCIERPALRWSRRVSARARPRRACEPATAAANA